MAEPSPDKVVIGAIGPLVTAVIGAAIGWLPGELTGAIGQPLTVLFAAAGGLSGLAFSLMYNRYLGVLDASKHPNKLRARAKTQAERNAYAERQAYDVLLESLRGGNIAARLYTDWLTKFLDAVDRFFGDAGMADQTLFPRAFGLRTPAPLWTALAFDRCLLLALIYTVASIFIIWAVSGRVGPAEDALDLNSHAAGWQRGLAVGVIGISIISFWRLMRIKELTFAAWSLWLVALSANIMAIDVVGLAGFAFCVAGAFALLRALILSIFASDFADSLTFAFGDFAVSVTFAFAVAFAFAFAFVSPLVVDPFRIFVDLSALAFAAAVAIAVAVLYDIATRKQRQGVFISLYLFAMLILCSSAARWWAYPKVWTGNGPLLLFLGLLPLINAQFDWASLGVTRALLRRGLELGGWWPYFLALADALAAAVAVALLAIAMVVGVQMFDDLAARYGLGGVPSLHKLFDGIAAQPTAPEYWWVYALLLSTMFPSLLNLMIGGASLLRGIPGLPALLLRFMPANKAVPAFDRTWLALVLTCQVFVGAFLGIAAQFVLAIGLIFYVLPWMGLELLDTARAVAEFDLPMRLLRLWRGSP
jgi:hypothetical protein